MKRFGFLVLMLALGALIGGSVGCSKKTASAPPVAEPMAPPERDQPVVSEPATEPEPEARQVELGDAFFDFDKSDIRPDARETLSANGRALLESRDVRIRIEGHCDERGTREYNMALGDRRARSARDFLVRFGVDPSRIEIISYGEERPFAQGHNETAWQLNRRAHFIIQE